MGIYFFIKPPKVAALDHTAARGSGRLYRVSEDAIPGWGFVQHKTIFPSGTQKIYLLSEIRVALRIFTR